MCGGGIIDRATDNLMKCGDLVCDYKSNDSWDKDNRDNTICNQSFTVSETGKIIPLNDRVCTSFNDRVCTYTRDNTNNDRVCTGGDESGNNSGDGGCLIC